ncbi:hypothetical protein Tco_0285958 [Tanacetum coccineum]
MNWAIKFPRKKTLSANRVIKCKNELVELLEKDVAAPGARLAIKLRGGYGHFKGTALSVFSPLSAHSIFSDVYAKLAVLFQTFFLFDSLKLVVFSLFICDRLSSIHSCAREVELSSSSRCIVDVGEEVLHEHPEPIYKSSCSGLHCPDEDMIKKILPGSPCLESLELNDCYGYRWIDITLKSVKKLVFSGYNSNYEIDRYEEAYIYCVRINAPYISSLTIDDELVLRELVLLNVSSLVKADFDYTIIWEREVSLMLEEKVFKALVESHGHVEDITFWGHPLERGTSDNDRVENGDREEQIA